VIGAGLLVFGGMLGLVGLFGAYGVFDRAPRWLIGPVFIVFMLLLVGAALWLFSPRGSDPFGRKTAEQHIRDLEGLRLIDSTEFHARRAFGVQEYEDEGLHYFMELADNRVLFLSGQYLYDYEPISDDPEMNQPRAFPCSEFAVRRHKKEGYVVEIRCGGAVLEPEVMAPPFGREVWRAGSLPEDGQVLVDITYDELKRQRMRGAGEQRDAADGAREG
jgi:hypothetical protein